MGCRVAASLPSFARDLHVLLVDCNSMFLAFMTSMLQHYSYKVTTAKLASIALSMIWEQNLQFNLVIADVDLPEMDIFSFLRLLRNDIPVILTSSVRDLKLARKSLAEGATYFLEKPILKEDIKYLWQHVYRKMKNPKDLKIEKVNYGKSFHDIEIQEENMRVCRVESKRKYDEEEGNIKSKRIRMNKEIIRMTEEEEVNFYDRIHRSINKKARIAWTTELQCRFTDELSKLSDEKARQKAVLKMMNNPSLTLHQVASHLQKYKSQIQSVNTKYQSKIPSSKQPHGSSQVRPTSWSCFMGVELNQVNTSDFLHIPSPFATIHLQPVDGNSENGGCNANKLFGLQPEICAEKQNYANEEVDELVQKGTPEDQILAGIEKTDGGDALDCPLNQMQTLKQYADVLKVLEGNLEEINCLGSEQNCDVDRYCEWLRENLFEEDKDQVMM